MSEELFQFLSLKKPANASKVIYTNTNNNASVNNLIYISGNWYDDFKVKEIINLAIKYPKAKIIISGGSGRLTLPHVKQMGGEPVYLFERLVQEASKSFTNLSGIQERCVLCNSSIVTTHNVRFLCYYLSQCADMEGWNQSLLSTNVKNNMQKYKIFVVDESFLLRRLKATLIQQIHIAANVKKDFPISMIDSIEFVCSNSQTSQDMENNHVGGKKVATYLQIGEIKRLINYSNGKEQNLFTKEQAGLNDDTTIDNLTNIVAKLEDDFMEELDQFLSFSNAADLQNAILPKYFEGGEKMEEV
jgi:hypothetical protein